MMKRKHQVLLGASVTLLVGFAAAWDGRDIPQTGLAAKMILIEHEQEYVTTFTTMMLSDHATHTIRKDMNATSLTQGQFDQVQDMFDRLVPRNPDTNEAYVFLSILDGGTLGAVLFSDSDYSITLTDEMIDLCGGEPDMLAGLLLHEIAHRDLKHSRIRLIGAALPEDRPALVLEDFETVAESYADHPERLVGFEFGPVMEPAARDYSDTKLREMGLETGGFERCLAILNNNREAPGVELFLRAHSLDENRVH
jgi:hypothetical protein